MSAAASSSKPADTAEPPKEESAQPTLGVLEEDDEFEEFAVQGPSPIRSPLMSFTFV